jgi:hypothetical protein
MNSITNTTGIKTLDAREFGASNGIGEALRVAMR